MPVEGALGKLKLLVTLGGAECVTATGASETAATEIGSAGQGAEPAGRDRPATRDEDGATSVGEEFGKPELTR